MERLQIRWKSESNWREGKSDFNQIVNLLALRFFFLRWKDFRPGRFSPPSGRQRPSHRAFYPPAHIRQSEGPPLDMRPQINSSSF